MLAHNLANAEGEWTVHGTIMPLKGPIVKHPIPLRPSFFAESELLLAPLVVILTNLQRIQ
jgi:hypothetical protein